MIYFMIKKRGVKELMIEVIDKRNDMIHLVFKDDFFILLNDDKVCLKDLEVDGVSITGLIIQNDNEIDICYKLV